MKNLCENCKYFYISGKQGICLNENFVHLSQGDFIDLDSSKCGYKTQNNNIEKKFIYYNYIVGKNFGCVHFEDRT